MTAALALLAWTALYTAAARLIWKSGGGHGKVYWLILCNGLFLIGVFVLYPWLRG